MGPYLYFRVLIFTVLASFTQRMSIQSACIQQWFRFKLLANFDFYLCLRNNFHTLSFWVLILAASGAYWVLISQKNGSLLGPYLKAWGSLLVLETVWRTNLLICIAFWMAIEHQNYHRVWPKSSHSEQEYVVLLRDVWCHTNLADFNFFPNPSAKTLDGIVTMFLIFSMCCNVKPVFLPWSQVDKLLEV